MATVSSGLQTPAFKAFIDIAPEKHVAGFGSDRDRKPVASSSGLKGLLVSLYNSIASAFSSQFSSDKAQQGAVAHEAFKSALKSEYGTDIGNKVAKRCGLDTALQSGKQLSGVVIQNAFKIAENLNQIAKFEKEVVDSTAFNDSNRFQSLCKGQGIDPAQLSNTQRDTFDALVRDSGLINRDSGAVGDKAPNVSLLIAGQELAIRVATMPDTAFGKHIATDQDSVKTQLKEGKIDQGKADEMRSKLIDAGRKMEFATGVHALGVGEFLSNVARSSASSAGQLARDLLVLVKTQNAVCNAKADIRAVMGKTTELGADELAVINETALQKALMNMPTGIHARGELLLVSLMAKNPSSALCRAAGVLENIISETTRTSDQNGLSGGVPQRGAASAWSIANTLVGLALAEVKTNDNEIRNTAFAKGQGMQHITEADTASVLVHANAFIQF